MKRLILLVCISLLSVTSLFAPYVASAQTPVASTTIANAAVPATVQKLFKEVFGKAISPTESDYWKQRARTDKRTVGTLRSAMQLQKSQGGTMPVPVICPRATPYPLTPEIKDALNAIQKGLLNKDPWKSKLPLKQFENCLDIRFVSDSSQQDSGVTASFWPRTSKSSDLKITVAPRIKSSGHVVLGQTLAHELTHVWQFEQYTEQQFKNPAFKNYKYPTCYDGEAEAIWTEISYLRSLAAANDGQLNDLLQDARRDPYTTRVGASWANYLLDFADAHWSKLNANPISFIRDNYVKTNPVYVAQCK